jgi:arabinofuranan 3-O-arabinosyltransferase
MLRNVSAEVSRPLLSRNVELICFALCVAQCVYLIVSLTQGSWILDPAGQPIPTDFVNVWASGRQALDGQPLDVYAELSHKAAEVAAVGHPFAGEYPWVYPPTFLFVATLLALLPFVAAYLAWIAVSFPAYAVTMRAIIGDRTGFLLACAYPGVLSNVIVGQNGFVTAALLGGSLLLLNKRPAVAGCLIGLLSFKPHLGVLFPLVLIATGQWRAIAAAAGVILALLVATAFAFGMESWYAFFQSLPIASHAALADGRADWGKLQSVFAVTRLAGGSEMLAWTLHISTAGAVAVLLCALWRSSVSFEIKAAALATGALLVTPYLFLYDLVVLAVPMAFLLRAGRNDRVSGEMLGIGCASLCVFIFPLVTVPVGLVAILVVGALVIRRARHDLARTAAPAGYPFGRTVM